MDVWQLFIRHAHRDLEDRSLDNGISESGKAQCLELVNYLEALRPQKMPTRVLSSPKRRCVETAEYVAAWAGVKVELCPEFDEQSAKEGDREFLDRVRKFVANNRSQTRICFVGHGDVLPIVARIYGRLLVEVKKANLFFVENEFVKSLNAVGESDKGH